MGTWHGSARGVRGTSVPQTGQPARFDPPTGKRHFGTGSLRRFFKIQRANIGCADAAQAPGRIGAGRVGESYLVL